MRIRIDKFLWAVRIFKTRSDGADTCRNNKVYLNGAFVKPSREVHPGDEISVKKQAVTFTYRVDALISSRQPAKNVPLYITDIIPASELEKLNVPRETIFVQRDRGAGRPTKKERRVIENIMDDLYYQEEE